MVGSPPVPVTGTDVYEWAEGGFFLVHHVDVAVGDRPVRSIGTIGERDPATGAFIARADDNDANVTIMHWDRRLRRSAPCSAKDRLKYRGLSWWRVIEKKDRTWFVRTSPSGGELERDA